MSFKDIKSSAVNIGKEIASYFDLSNDLIPQQDAELEIRSSVSFKGSQLIILIIANIIASVGLNTNSLTILIGAMLISPLMGPIIGMGLAIGVEDYALLRRSLKNILMAMVGSILAAALYFVISPQYENPSQLLARTSPTIYDVFIGFFGGAAGIISITCKNKANVMPGVAIATSLMPPLCTVGYGLVTLQVHFIFGALYLFFTNLVFIMFATWIVVKIMGYKKVVYQNESRAHRIKGFIYVIVCLTIGVSVYLTYQMFNKNMFLSKATNFVENEMVFPNTQVLNHEQYIKNGKRYIDVTLIGAALPKDSLQLAMMHKLDSVGLGGTILNIKQGFSIGRPDFDDDRDIDKFYGLMQVQLSDKEATIDSLKQVIKSDRFFSQESSKISDEIRVLFPAVEDLSLARMTATNVDNEATDTINVVFVRAPRGMLVSEQQKLKEFISVRLNRKNVHLTVNPSGFPWPQKEPAGTPRPNASK